tara:strand:+ start:4861 stop:5025 length:165 start_codon:yes stop_codon:yes gene_type:complete
MCWDVIVKASLVMFGACWVWAAMDLLGDLERCVSVCDPEPVAAPITTSPRGVIL